jgi:hypothetical protein
MVCEPALAPNIPAASHAHVRIDDWHAAESWIMARIEDAIAAPQTFDSAKPAADALV